MRCARGGRRECRIGRTALVPHAPEVAPQGGCACGPARQPAHWSDARPKEAHRDQNLPLPDPSPTCLHANGPSPRARRVRRNLSGGSLASPCAGAARRRRARAPLISPQRARQAQRREHDPSQHSDCGSRARQRCYSPAQRHPPSPPCPLLCAASRRVRASVARDAAQQLHMAAGCRLLHVTAGLCTCSERAHGIVSVAYVHTENESAEPGAAPARAVEAVGCVVRLKQSEQCEEHRTRPPSSQLAYPASPGSLVALAA